MAGAGLAAVAGTVAACTGGGASSSSATQTVPPLERTLSPTTSPQAYPAAAWPTFNGNAARSGSVSGLPAAGRLSIDWKVHLDGTVYGQPLLIGDLVVAATENDTFYALDRSTGKVVWSRHVATPLPKSGQHGCGDIDPLGITGTPVYDQGYGVVYGVAQTSSYQHILFGVSVSDGAVKVERYIPTPDGSRPGISSDRRWPRRTGGRTCRSADWSATAARTSARS
jgi:hypothetical protein